MRKVLGFPLSCIWISESRITDWRLPGQCSIKRVKSQRRGEKRCLSRNSAVQSAKQLRVAAVRIWIIKTHAYNFFPCRSVHLLELTVFFVGWDTLCFHLCFPAALFGYNEVTMIPAGATHIRVTDNSRNYLGWWTLCDLSAGCVFIKQKRQCAQCEIELSKLL